MFNNLYVKQDVPDMDMEEYFYLARNYIPNKL